MKAALLLLEFLFNIKPFSGAGTIISVLFSHAGRVQL